MVFAIKYANLETLISNGKLVTYLWQRRRSRICLELRAQTSDLSVVNTGHENFARLPVKFARRPARSLGMPARVDGA